MEAGTLRRRGTINSLGAGKDSYGASTAIYNVLVISAFMAYEPLLGKEYFAADAAQSLAECKFRMRYVAGIDRTMRIAYDGREYEILSPPVDVHGRHKELVLYCRQVI